jgi:hypothetical protein
VSRPLDHSPSTFSSEVIEPLSAVASAAASGATVTVVREDGKSATGTVAPHPTDPALYKVVTGRRGRPFVFHPDDVEVFAE